MIPVRTIVWIILFIGIILNVFHVELVNVVILSMVKNRNSNDVLGVNNNDDKSICGYRREKVLSIVNKSSTTINDNRLDWSKSDQNLVLGSAFWIVWIGNFVTGLLIHRFGMKMTVGVSTIICAILSFLTPPSAYVHPICTALISAIKGFFTTVLYPVGAVVLIGKWSPLEERGKFMSVSMALPIGGSLGFLIFPYISEQIGWMYAFHTAGALSLLWCIGCWYFVYDTPEQHPRIKENERRYIQLSLGDEVSNRKIQIPWSKILTSVPFYIIICNHFGFFWLTVVVNVYGPMYFYDLFGFSTEKSGLIMGISYFLRAVFSYIGGVITDCMVKRKMLSLTNIRKMWTVSGAIVPGLSFFLLVFCFCNASLSIIGVVANITFSSFFNVGTGTSIIDLSPNFCDILQGVASTIGFTAGPILAVFVQYISNIYDTYMQWQIIFAVSAVVEILPAILFLLFGTSQVQPWNNPPSADCDTAIASVSNTHQTNIKDVDSL